MVKDELTFSSLFGEPEHSIAYAQLSGYMYPWEALDHIAEIIEKLIPTLPRDLYEERSPGIWVATSATVAPSAYIGAPCIICEDAEIRHGAFIRGTAIIGRGAVVGNSVELKNCILFDGVQVPHFNYVGDSILGYRAHMGAGAVTSNVKGNKSLVSIWVNGNKIETGRKKLGAILGDYAEIGCNCVLNPGTVIGKNTQVYPLSAVRGYIPCESIYKSSDTIIKKYENK